MTYLRDGIEYLEPDEHKVYLAVQELNLATRTCNNSQIASMAGLSRTTVGRLTQGLRARSYLKDVSTNAAHHWRLTGKPAETSWDEVPEVILAHFDRKRLDVGDQRRPLYIKQVFFTDPGRWEDQSPRLLPTWALIRQHAAKGAHTVAVAGYGVVADFPIQPMLDAAERPLIGGSLIGSRTSKAR